MNRAEKAEVIASLKGAAQSASIAVVADFKGMSVEEMTGLRVKCRENGVSFQVVKNTLARIALAESDHEIVGERLTENNAIAFGYDDPVVAAKVFTSFQKEFPKSKLALKFASLQGKLLEEEAVKDLSKLPSREELLSKLLGTMNAVPQSFVGLLANVPRGMLNVLTAIKDQKDEGAEAA
ncbi:50S ribosomal protein L10 [Desulfohalovibrio reitneri]|uniref:50S ribosomal protein L10 n=1 Tax=Desulfohalovibrio reitneri TaxID=1307759 RepID=UPI0004A6DB8C|nr:50S ribosomal protein L10 [Desulfohalovibrio reitneri]